MTEAIYHFFQSYRLLFDLADSLIVSFIIYRAILLIRGTRAVQMLAGIFLIIIVYFIARELQLLTLYWLLGRFLSSILLIIIIIFQRDIRRALTQMGQTPFATRTGEDESQSLDEVISASEYLAKRKIGGLIVIERETGLRDYIESAVSLDAKLSKELLISLFHTSSPLQCSSTLSLATPPHAQATRLGVHIRVA